ncbi:MAG: hypothetical protein IME92_03350 [Proteobacteria bacterium]|nr:hypothetical protein [Pseudomonadota bacterium]
MIVRFMVILVVMAGCSHQLVGNAEPTYQSNEEFFGDYEEDEDDELD